MKRILIADDHSIIRRCLRQILKDEFSTVDITEVADGASLVKEVTCNDFDFVISDLDMPGVSGLDALHQVKQIKPNLPVLILSGFTEDLFAIRVLKAGGSGYINKNAAPCELINAIRQIALGQKYITPEIAEKFFLDVAMSKKADELLTNWERDILKLLSKENQ